MNSYLWGHLTAVHDAMPPLLSLGERLHPEFDVAFVSNPVQIASLHSFARASSAGMERQQCADTAECLWTQWDSDIFSNPSRHSKEEFAKDPSRTRFAILLRRTNHLSYHIGQWVLALK